MSDLHKLREVLRDTARDGPISTSVKSYGDASDAVRFILQSIDRAVLGRQITFTFDDGAALRCVASGRRLIRFLPPAPSGLEVHAPLFDVSDIRSDSAEAVAGLLAAICAPRSKIDVTADPRDDDPDPLESGIAPSDISDALGLDTTGGGDGSGAEALDAFLGDISGRLTAALWIVEKDISIALGDDNVAAKLAKDAAPFIELAMDPKFPLSASLETDGILTFCRRDDDPTHILIAGRLGQFLVAQVSDDDEPATLKAWRNNAC
jgi:hypothetical protein